MSAPTTIRPAVGIRRSRVAVSASYAAQGFGYAVVVTSLPNLKSRYGIDDTVVSLIVLLVCLAAAGGSLLADRLAVRWGSRVALVVGLLLEAVALPLIASPVGLPAFIAAFAIYGAGLGIVDAAGAMQGVLVQQRVGVSVMAGFFAWYTGAAIAGALLMSAVAGTAANAGIALVAGAVVALAVAIVGVRGFDPRRTKLPPAPDAAPHGKLPRRGIVVFGTVVLAAFVVDSAVSTWSTVYLHDVLLTGAASPRSATPPTRPPSWSPASAPTCWCAGSAGWSWPSAQRCWRSWAACSWRRCPAPGRPWPASPWPASGSAPWCRWRSARLASCTWPAATR